MLQADQRHWAPRAQSVSINTCMNEQKDRVRRVGSPGAGDKSQQEHSIYTFTAVGPILESYTKVQFSCVAHCYLTISERHIPKSL